MCKMIDTKCNIIYYVFLNFPMDSVIITHKRMVASYLTWTYLDIELTRI
jgi:hypothetical protein